MSLKLISRQKVIYCYNFVDVVCMTMIMQASMSTDTVEKLQPSGGAWYDDIVQIFSSPCQFAGLTCRLAVSSRGVHSPRVEELSQLQKFIKLRRAPFGQKYMFLQKHSGS